MPTRITLKRAATTTTYCVLTLSLFVAFCSTEIDIETKTFCPLGEQFCFFYLSKPGKEIRCLKSARYMCSSLLDGGKLADSRTQTSGLKNFMTTYLPNHKIIVDVAIYTYDYNNDPDDNSMGAYSPATNNTSLQNTFFHNKFRSLSVSKAEKMKENGSAGSFRQMDVKRRHSSKAGEEKSRIDERFSIVNTEKTRNCETPMLVYDVNKDQLLKNMCPGDENVKYSLLCIKDCAYEWTKHRNQKLDTLNLLDQFYSDNLEKCQKRCISNLNCSKLQYSPDNPKDDINCLLAVKSHKIVSVMNNNNIVYSSKLNRAGYCVVHKIQRTAPINIPSCSGFLNYWIIVFVVLLCWVASFALIYAIIKYKKETMSIEPDFIPDYYD